MADLFLRLHHKPISVKKKAYNGFNVKNFENFYIILNSDVFKSVGFDFREKFDIFKAL